MGTDKQINHNELASLCVRLHLGVSGSELHGSVCGFLAGGGHMDTSPLVVLQLDSEGSMPGKADESMLAALVQQSITGLSDVELVFQPVLPSDDRPLTERGEALGHWCRGFLGGFGLAGSPPQAKLSEEAQEILRDLAMLAATELEFDDGDDDENGLTELQEFVRVGAMLLHAECALGRNRPTDQTVH